MNNGARDALQNPAQRHTNTQKQYRLLALAMLLVCVLVMGYVLYYPQFIGAADHGDSAGIAARAGIGSAETTVETDANSASFSDTRAWLPFSAQMLNPLAPAFSNVYPISLIRLAVNVAGDTAQTPYRLWYLSLVCVPLLLFAFYLLIKFGLDSLGLPALFVIALGMLMLLGSAHLGLLHSLYGEAMNYVWLLVLLGCACAAAMARRGSLYGKVLSVCSIIAMYMMVTATVWTVVSYPVWFVLLLVLLFYHFLGGKASLPRRAISLAIMLVLIAGMLCSGWSCVKLYQQRQTADAGNTATNSLFMGLLPLTDDPAAVLTELGLDPALAQPGGEVDGTADAPISDAADTDTETALVSVGTLDIVTYYIKHPVVLYRALQRSAQDARQYSAQLLYAPSAEANSETTIETDVRRFAFWETVRPYVTPGSAMYYAAFYLVLLFACIAGLIRARGNGRKQLLILLYLGLLLTGVLQYLLSILSGGGADPAMQLYPFMLSYDLALLAAVGWLIAAVRALLARNAKGAQLDKQIQALEARLEHTA